MNRWLDDATALLAADEPAVLVTVAGVRGSAPREVGARMLVSRRETFGTIGGGQLEYQCTRIACDRLRRAEHPAPSLRRFPLGADCGQCCGGVVDVLFEDLASARRRIEVLSSARSRAAPALSIAFSDENGDIARAVVTDLAALPAFGRDDRAVGDIAARALTDGEARRIARKAGGFVLVEPQLANDFHVAVFGAGHVGTATVAALAMLDASIRWIDSRPGLLPESTPANVQTLTSSVPPREVAALPGNSFFLVMTHSHPLDYDICRAVLERDDFAYLGLIGSRSKRRRFEARFRKEGVGGLERLTCPIGIEGISGKAPAEIAVAVAAQLLERRESFARAATTEDVRPISRHLR